MKNNNKTIDIERIPMFRFNTRIFEYQRDFIKKMKKASKKKLSEGEINRKALDFYMRHHNKKK